MFNKEVLRAVHTLHGKSRRWLSKFFKYDRPSIIINMAKGEVGESELKEQFLTILTNSIRIDQSLRHGCTRHEYPNIL